MTKLFIIALVACLLVIASKASYNTPVQNIRTGYTSMLITDTFKDIAFSSPMPNTNYTVCFEPNLAITSSLGISFTNKTVNGFTIKSVGVAITSIKYCAIGDQ